MIVAGFWKSLLAVFVAFVGADLARAADTAKPKPVLAWGKKGDKPGEFYSPIHIVVTKQDEILVADLNNARLQKFDTEGKYLAGVDLPLDNPPRKSCMIGGMAVDDRGLVYLSFMIQHRIAVYSQDGKVVRQWGKKGTGDVQKFTLEGKFLAKWGEYGDKAGQFGTPNSLGSRFAGPHFLTQDSKGRLYATEGVRGRVQQLSTEGKPLLAWGSKGDEPGGFGALQTGYAKGSFGPIGAYVDRQDRVWISSLNDRVQAFTTEGKYLLGISGSGKELGQLTRPHGMAMDSKGYLYVADAGNQRIQKFEIPKP